jgi:hypothetical protein
MKYSNFIGIIIVIITDSSVKSVTINTWTIVCDTDLHRIIKEARGIPRFDNVPVQTRLIRGEKAWKTTRSPNPCVLDS